MARCASATATGGSRTLRRRRSRCRCPNSRRASVGGFAFRSSRVCCRRALNAMPPPRRSACRLPTPSVSWPGSERSWRARSPCCPRTKNRAARRRAGRPSRSRMTNWHCCLRRSGHGPFWLVPRRDPGEYRGSRGKACGCRWPEPSPSCRSYWSMTASRFPHPASRPRTFSSRRSPASTTQPRTRPLRCALRRAWGLRSRRCARPVVADRTYLLVERYDRRVAPGGLVERLHQEDFCQALGIVPDRKYASDGGPGFPQCFELVRRVCTRPAGDVLGLLDAAIVQVLLGNADAHGKNRSVFVRTRGGQLVLLAPLYDLLSTIAYPRYSPRLAMSIVGRRTLEDLRPGDWDRFARRCGLGPRFVRRRVAELCTAASEASGSVVAELALPGLREEALVSQAELVGKRAARLADTVV